MRPETKYLLALSAAAFLIAGCESGDVVLQPTNIDNSTSTGGGGGGNGGGTDNPCASYVDPDSNVTRQGAYDGQDCTYGLSFVSSSSPLRVDLTIPLIDGMHIFLDSLFVGEDVSSGAAPAGGTGPVLTIEPGNVIAFTDPADYVQISRGSQIIADGTADAPITFTGVQDEAFGGSAGPETVSLWGGIQINGNGLTNNCTDTQRENNDCHVLAEGIPTSYGGNDNEESSGVLRYVVVKHTGFEVAPGDELNGITFNAVGSGTVVSHIQTYSTFDDGIEFFGGAVNVDHFVGVYVRDDSIDYSDGWVGSVDTALIIQSQTDGNRCIEADNIGSTRADGGQPLDTEPQTNAVINNMTCIMSNSDGGTHDASQGILLRLGAQSQIMDSIVFGGYAQDVGVDNYCLRLNDGVTQGFAESGDTTFSNVLIACELAVFDSNWSNAGDVFAGAAPYTFNEGNVAIWDPQNANAQVLDCIYTPSELTDENGDPLEFVDGDGAPVSMGAVTRDDDWTAGWTYGIHPENRGQPLWFEGLQGCASM